MKTLCLLLFLVFSVRSQAETHTIIDRDDSGKMIYSEVELTQLLNPEYTETADFKVVRQKSNDALKWADLSEVDHLRAANLIYHLTRAKQKLILEFNAKELKALEQIIVRIDFSTQPSRQWHFSNDDLDPMFNTAHTIPAGPGDEKRGVAPWKREIWFRPAKRIPVKQILKQLDEDPMNPTLQSLRKVAYPLEVTLATGNLAQDILKSSSSSTYVDFGISQIETFLVIEGAFQASKIINRLVLPNNFFLDSAMIPEVIYHEFGHVAFSDYLIPTQPMPVLEGVADYMASVVSGDATIAKKIKLYSNGMAKDGRKKKKFMIDYETKGKATSDFVLSLLWGLGKKTKKDPLFGREIANQLVWESRKYLNTYDSNIRDQLLGALLKSCETVCENPISDRLRMREYFDTVFNQPDHGLF